MVGKLPTLLTGAHRPNGRSNANPKPPVDQESKTTLRHDVAERETGAECQINITPKNIGAVFFLDIPFYRTLPLETFTTLETFTR
jgi:hypothetical protein